jgi:hypothetical protein
MKNLFKVTPKEIADMSPEEFNGYVHNMVMSYKMNSKTSKELEAFYYEGVRFDKDTPDRLWDWLGKEWKLK